MAKYLLLFFLLFCSFVNAEQHIDIYYLTARDSCPTVNLIEKITNNILQQNYDYEIQNKIIVKHKINIFENKNQEFVKKWDIYTNGIMLLHSINNDTTKLDLNDLAFSNIPSDSANYKKEFIKLIEEFLNKK